MSLMMMNSLIGWAPEQTQQESPEDVLRRGWEMVTNNTSTQTAPMQEPQYNTPAQEAYQQHANSDYGQSMLNEHYIRMQQQAQMEHMRQSQARLSEAYQYQPYTPQYLYARTDTSWMFSGDIGIQTVSFDGKSLLADTIAMFDDKDQYFVVGSDINKVVRGY